MSFAHGLRPEFRFPDVLCSFHRPTCIVYMCRPIAASIDLQLRRGCVRRFSSKCHLLLQNNLQIDSDRRRSAVVVVSVTIINLSYNPLGSLNSGRSPESEAH